MFHLLTITVIVAWLTCLAAEERSLKVHVATWNVNSQKPPDDLSKLLGQMENQPAPDVVVLGLQEVTMNPKEAIFDYLFHDKWTLKLNDVLGNDYTKVKSKVLVSVAMMVYVKKEHAGALREIDGFSLRTGFGGLYGNKGAVGVNFRLYNKRFGFVNSHLPAHDEAVNSRIEDIGKIETHRKKNTWNAQDFLFWLGDLNFRVAETNWDAETINSMLYKGLVKEVLANDQLNQLKSAGTIFVDWQEAEINFKPTFKVLVGDGSYNLKRRPAWTDRILYKSETGNEIVNTLYDSVDGYLQSDHKPVRADFELPVDV
uniref:Phosphatidylinositol 4,5-bisphosphate 5-phosphatase A n=1 Tax=Lygus hesperus TaxID=30085 RepID=A0A146KL96_LYGHE